jgi:hypothetical protein
VNCLRTGEGRDIIFSAHGGCSSMAECLTVDQDVVGSTPISHPKKKETERFLFFIGP